jgi:hypothetical protein
MTSLIMNLQLAKDLAFSEKAQCKRPLGKDKNVIDNGICCLLVGAVFNQREKKTRGEKISQQQASFPLECLSKAQNRIRN